MKHSSIISAVKTYIKDLFHAHKLHLRKRNLSSAVMEFLDLSETPIITYKVQLIRWTLPIIHQVKLNFDGVCKGNPGESGARGVLRNHEAKLLAFAHYLGINTSVYTKAKAILLGLIFAKKLNYSSIWNESNSLLLMACLNNSCTAP